MPGYVKQAAEFKAKGYEIFVVTANDAFVVSSWAKTYNADGKVRAILGKNHEVMVFICWCDYDYYYLKLNLNFEIFLEKLFHFRFF